jgi:hypothetical protein
MLKSVSFCQLFTDLSHWIEAAAWMNTVEMNSDFVGAPCVRATRILATTLCAQA